jgi:hypothetical protein
VIRLMDIEMRRRWRSFTGEKEGALYSFRSTSTDSQTFFKEISLSDVAVMSRDTRRLFQAFCREIIKLPQS